MGRRQLAAVKVALFCACLAPLAWLVARGVGVSSWSLGPNPVDEVLHTLGKTALNLLMVTLAVTPIRRLTGLNWLVRLRRMLGVFCFFYAFLHLLSYAVLDQRLSWRSLLVDVTERPYITAGMLAVTLMLPLAVTSTNGWQRRLGRRWVKLHRLVYPVSVLGVVHFYWQTKADVLEPLLHAGGLAALLAFRAGSWWRLRRRRVAPGAGRAAAERAQ